MFREIFAGFEINGSRIRCWRLLAVSFFFEVGEGTHCRHQTLVVHLLREVLLHPVAIAVSSCRQSHMGECYL